MESPSAKGRCQCGAIEFEVQGDPLFAGICHCVACKKVHSALCVPFITFGASNFKYTKGESLVQRYNSFRSFCSSCGTRIANELQQQTGQVITFPGILQYPPGTLPAKFKPTAHVNYESRFIDMNDDLPKYKGPIEKGIRVDSAGNEISLSPDKI